MKTKHTIHSQSSVLSAHSEQELREFIKNIMCYDYLAMAQDNGKELQFLEDRYTNQLKKLIQSEREKVLEEIHKSFINKYRGAGEVWFPYESTGNCTKEEELQAVEDEWAELAQKEESK